MLLGGEQPRLPLVLEPVAFAPDVEHVAVVQQPVQDGWGDDGVAAVRPNRRAAAENNPWGPAMRRGRSGLELTPCPPGNPAKGRLGVGGPGL